MYSNCLEAMEPHFTTKATFIDIIKVTVKTQLQVLGVNISESFPEGAFILEMGLNFGVIVAKNTSVKSINMRY